MAKTTKLPREHAAGIIHAAGEEARKLRKALCLSQEDVARASGVSQGAVSRFEGGRGVSVPFIGVAAICSVLAAARTKALRLSTGDALHLPASERILGVAEFVFDGTSPAAKTEVMLDRGFADLIRMYGGKSVVKRGKIVSTVKALSAVL